MSFILLHAIKWACDKLSDRTNGAFGYCTPPQAPEGAHAPEHKQAPEEYSVGGKPSASSEESIPNGQARVQLLFLSLQPGDESQSCHSGVVAVVGHSVGLGQKILSCVVVFYFLDAMVGG